MTIQWVEWNVMKIPLSISPGLSSWTILMDEIELVEMRMKLRCLRLGGPF
jgi:hypothetical protein